MERSRIMTDAAHTVSVIVPVRNAARTVPDCLASLVRLDPLPHEIILVDNGSSDGTPPLLQEFAQRHPGLVRLVEEGRRGASIARNSGAWAAKGTILAFTDSDCVVTATWLRELLAPFADPTVGAVAGRIDSTSPTSTIQLFCTLYTLQSPNKAARYESWTPTTGGFPTANLAIRRDLMERLKGFDESVAIYGEDYDLCARLYGQGASLMYRPEARVVHNHRTRLSALLRQAFGFGRSHAYMLRKHTRRGCWLEWPRRSLTWPACPFPVWVNFTSADKKLLGLLIVGALWPPSLGLLGCYAVWLAWDAQQRATRAGIRTSAPTALALAGLHVLKAGAMTLGRWFGSVMYRIACF